MAALDFPASPTNNQTFAASNGVVYRWVTPPGIWIAVTGGNAFASDIPPSNPVANQLWFNSAQAALYIYYNDGNTSQWVPASPSVTAVTSPGGDFMAQNSANVVTGLTLTTVLWDTVITGNSLGSYQPSTGRYTPPAGRYFIQATMGMGAMASSQSTADIYIRKNGVVVARGGNVAANVNWWADSAAAVVIDANGSDYFDVQIQFNVAGAYMQATAGKFLAFPISGVRGPPGEPYPGTVGGDFFASIGAGMAITGTPATVLFPTVQTGNSGGWYSPATGRFIPPQGRYNIFAQVYNNGANNTGSVQLYKNGVAVPGAYSAGFNAAGSQTGTISAVVDANGTDYFDIRVWGNNAATVQQGSFGGYPITGVKGPPGDPYSMTQVGGDFFAQGSTFSIGTSLGTPLNMPVLTGNSGNWFTSATGRYVPPAGRYNIFAGYTFTGPSSLVLGSLALRKNGAIINQMAATSGTSANHMGDISSQALVDANGTDWFDVQCSAHVPTNSNTVFFGGYPITGVKGPPGDPGPGALALYSEQVLAAPANVMAVSFPPTAKLVQLFWDYLLTPVADSAIAINGTAGGAPNTTSTYSYQRLQGTNSSAGAGTASADWSVNQPQWAPWSAPNTRGMITFTTPTQGKGFGEYVNITQAGIRQITNIHLEAGGISGLDGYRLSVASGNFAAGSFLRCLVVM